MLTLRCPVPVPRLEGRTSQINGYAVRACTGADDAALSSLYFESYDPGVAWGSLQEAAVDIAATCAGEYGLLLTAASLLAFTPDGALAAAVLIVERPPWEDTPDCPFVIGLFTDRAHRRRGLGAALLVGSAEVLASDGHVAVALRVAPDNEPAVRLYRGLGFEDWSVG